MSEDPEPPTRHPGVPRHDLETARLTLRPLRVEDAPALFEAAAASLPELLPWMPWAPEQTLDQNVRFAERAQREWAEARSFHFVLVERGTGAVVGAAGLHGTTTEALELGYWVRSDRAGRGLATEAGRALVAWAHALGVARLTLWAGRDNLASRRVAVKLGFVQVGPLAEPQQGGLGLFPAEAYELSLAAPAPP